MLREIVFDTETTGLDPENGDRVVEIGMVELMDLVPTGKHFHVYINPLMKMPYEAFKVHGLSDDFLADKPTFADPSIVDAMLDFIGDSQLVAHNAEFDRKFLNAELDKVGKGFIEKSRCVDTYVLARKIFPGAPASLDALCKRFAIDLKERTLHGALLDSQLLASVYLELMGGRERSFGFIDDSNANPSGKIMNYEKRGPRQKKLPPLLTEEEIFAHNEFVKTLGENAFWIKNN